MKQIKTIVTKVVELSKEEFSILNSGIKSTDTDLGYTLNEEAIAFFYDVGKRLNFINGPSHWLKGFDVQITFDGVIEISENTIITESVWKICFVREA